METKWIQRTSGLKFNFMKSILASFNIVLQYQIAVYSLSQAASREPVECLVPIRSPILATVRTKWTVYWGLSPSLSAIKDLWSKHWDYQFDLVFLDLVGWSNRICCWSWCKHLPIHSTMVSCVHTIFSFSYC